MTNSKTKLGSAKPPAAPKERKPANTSAQDKQNSETTGNYGSSVRQQVFEVVVRQALAGAPWREICAGPMQVNMINPEEIEAEVLRRRSLI